ncbi:MAG: hypothetical protein ACFFD2_15990 [Promethearchaeota archaeon]
MRNRYKTYFLLVIILVISLSYLASFTIAFANSRCTSYSEASGSYHAENHENDVASYRFSKDYSPHDWIADSAVRIIADSENTVYRNKIKWLYNDGIQFKDFDTAYASGSSRAEWFSSESFHASRLIWLKARIYMRYLHGTTWPDFEGDFPQYNVLIGKGGPKAEEVNKKVKVGYKGCSHSFTFNYSVASKTFIPINQGAGTGAQRAAQDAIDFLNYEETVDGVKKKAPKYEAAGLALGAMAHFIGDLAHPQHTYKEDHWKQHKYNGVSQRTDGYIDYWVDQEIVEITNDRIRATPYFPNGGPDWTECDVSTLKIDDNYELYDATDEYSRGLTHLYPPFYCAMRMAYLTHTGYEKYNRPYGDDENNLPGYQDKPWYGDFAAYRLPTLNWRADYYCKSSKKPSPWGSDVSAPPFKVAYQQARKNTENRVNVLMKWAAYYTACAILWTLNQTEIAEDTISDRFIAYSYGDLGRSPVDNAILDQQIEKAIADEGSKIAVPDSGWNLAMSLSLLVPILSLVVLPAVTKVAIQQSKGVESEKKSEVSSDTISGVRRGIGRIGT